MIHDKLDNLKNYLLVNDYDLIETTFLKLVSVSMQERIYPIDGDRIYARVMSYATKDSDNCKLEAHDKYIDIQCTICGAEGIDIYNRDCLVVSESYNEENDVVFFQREENAKTAHTNNLEGYFTMLWPREAHSPQIRVGKFKKVKKFVIKYAI